MKAAVLYEKFQPLAVEFSKNGRATVEFAAASVIVIEACLSASCGVLFSFAFNPQTQPNLPGTRETAS